MIATGKIIKVGGSLVMVIPKEIIKKMKILRNENVLMRYDKKKVQITKMSDIINNIDEKEDS